MLASKQPGSGTGCFAIELRLFGSLMSSNTRRSVWTKAINDMELGMGGILGFLVYHNLNI